MKCHQIKIKLDSKDIFDSEYIQFQEHKDHIGWVVNMGNYDSLKNTYVRSTDIIKMFK